MAAVWALLLAVVAQGEDSVAVQIQSQLRAANLPLYESRALLGFYGRREAQRDFSHGCIRVEKPLDLAVYLMKKTKWNRDAIEAALDEGTERTIYLVRPTSVHLLYWTAP
jgi:uncharacterized protein (DUF2132 family)